MPVPPPKILPRRKAPLLSMPEQHTMPSYTAGGHAGDPRHDPERGKSASGSDGSAKDGVVTRRAGKRREWDGSPTIGLFNNHRDTFSSRYHLTRRGKVKRLGQIMRIANQFDVVHGLTPVKMRLMLEALGPTFVKVGQILSMRSEILPQSFCDELAKLRADADPMPYQIVVDTLTQEYGRPIGEVFARIDPTPLGSASLAQVHRATLVTGRRRRREGAAAWRARDHGVGCVHHAFDRPDCHEDAAQCAGGGSWRRGRGTVGYVRIRDGFSGGGA